MPAMAEYRSLGKSGLRVSVPVLGGMSFGSSKWIPWVVPEEQGLKILKAAWDLGINTIDTANVYSNGESERTIARFMSKVLELPTSFHPVPFQRCLTHQYNIPRKNLVIMSKAWGLVSPDVSVMAPMIPGLADTRDYVNQGGLSRTALFNALDAILTRLDTPYLDLFQIHAFDAGTPIEETMKALHDLVISGKVRYIGACNLKMWQFAEMNHVAERNGWTQFVSIQIEHSLLYRAEELEMLAYCNFEGVGILSWAPLMNGQLARPLGTETSRSQMLKGTPFEKKIRESDAEIIKRVEKLAADHSWPMSQVALSWTLSKVSSPIVGVNKPERVQESIVTGKMLKADEVKYLEEPYEFQPPRM
ncbi:hypothetical protein EW146_g1765 [Bondarzewia mesenterica]|uniref:NADP-dependent oxidoreductase domain-containing protein n=1 Tax=Bondarzewia mesenterica TaxID=1095465 RepID=A0A4S4M4P8_9AGAM|nr:hypothetical protein EW146_g1765 [Bondarzewia mesenterica]